MNNMNSLERVLFPMLAGIVLMSITVMVTGRQFYGLIVYIVVFFGGSRWFKLRHRRKLSEDIRDADTKKNL